HRVFAQERETAEDAYPGDVVGLVNPGMFAIGDTICEGAPFRFDPLPRFTPEHFARLAPQSPDKRKPFNKGLGQLEEEGAIQVLYAETGFRLDPILAAVGELQFDLVRARLSAEYGVETRLERLPFRAALVAETAGGEARVNWDAVGALGTRDRRGTGIALIEGDWAERHLRELNPEVRFARMT
ncbi:MAG: peptide chain release factor 3, partial [Vicinamibacteria bacterium]